MSEHEQDTAVVDEWESLEISVRPRWPKVIGIISIVWGSLGLVCGGVGTAWAVVAPSFMEQALDGDPMPDGMKMHAADYGIMGLSLGLALLLLFAGIAAVSYRPVTRMMHLTYGLASFPVVIWSYLNNNAKQASLQEWAQQYPDNPVSQSMQGQGAAAGQLVGLVLLILLGFGVPLFYLIWFGLLKTKPEQITGGDEGVY